MSLRLFVCLFGCYPTPVIIPTGTPRRIHVDSTWILRQYVEDQMFDEFPRHFRALFQCNFDGRKFQVFPRTFFEVVSLVEKSRWFPCSFFDVISMVEKSTLFPSTFIGVITMVEICTLFLLTFFSVTLMDKDLTSLLVSCKLMKTFEKVFPVFVTLNC